MAFHHGAMAVRDVVLKFRNDDEGIGSDGVCVYDIVADAGNEGVGVRDFMTNVGNGYIHVYCKFGLEVNSWRGSYGSDGTHVKDMKDPVEIQPPGRDRLFIVLRMKHPGGRISSTPLDDVLLDLGHSPVIGSSGSEWPGVCVAGSTHVVNCPIASNMD